jgi:hypothetical protein
MALLDGVESEFIFNQARRLSATCAGREGRTVAHMALMYIDTHDHQRPLPPRHQWRPDIRPVLQIALAIFLMGVSQMVSPLPSYLLTLAAVVVVARTASKWLPSSNGLRDYHQ